MPSFETQLLSASLRRKMMNIAMSKTKNIDNAEDLVQNTYLKAFENRKKFTGNKLDPWVITILKNLFIDSTRRGTFTTKEASRDFNNKIKIETIRVKREHLFGDDNPEAAIQDESETMLLKRDENMCLDKLSDNEREIIDLHQNSTYQEISEDLGIDAGTLRQRKLRAQEKFIECMGFNNE